MKEISEPIIELLRHAPWYAPVIGGVALVLAFVWSQRRRVAIAQRRIAAALAVVPVSPDDWRDGDEVAIRGVLDTERPITSVAVLGFGGGRELCELGHTSADAWIEVGAARVALDGPVAVSVGSHVIRHHTLPTSHFEAATIGRDRARRTMQLGFWPSGIDAYHLRKVKPRDEVFARGKLARTDAGWALRPIGNTPEKAAIEVTAVAAVVDPVPAPPLGTLARSFLVGVAAGVAVAVIAYAS